MSLDAIGLVLLSAIMHIGWNVLVKSSSDPKSFTLFSGIITVSIAIVVMFFVPIAAISNEIWLYMFASGLMHALYVYGLSSAYQSGGDISFVYPIARSAPAFVAILAIWIFHESLSPLAFTGVGLVTVGIFLLQMRGETLPEQWHNLLNFLHKHDSLWAFITLGSVIAYTLTDKGGMMAFGQIEAIDTLWRGPIYFLVTNTISYFFYASTLAIRREKIQWSMWKTAWPRVIVTVAGSFLSYSIILYVLQTEAVSLVAALRQSSILFAVMVGWFFLKEHHGALRLAAAVGMLIGLTLVATSN
jgi:drug/metabolite transporter (DMT)-like permease